MNVVSRKKINSNRNILKFWALIFRKTLFFFYKKLSHKNRIYTDNLKYSLKREFEKHHKLINTYLISLLQKTSVAYILGAFLWIILTITISDLAFAWSSTLNINANHIHSVTNTISLPWNSLFPNAVVDLDIIERSRYYRAYGTAIPDGSTAHDLGTWWAFLIMSIFTYSFLPRVISHTYYKFILQKTLKESVERSPEGQRLLDQMNRPRTSTKPISHPNDPNDPKSPDLILDENDSTTFSNVVFLWNIKKEMISVNDLNNKISSGDTKLFTIGGINTPDDDKKIIDKSLKYISSNFSFKQIFILVEYYESPNVDFLNILSVLRKLIDNRLITIVPIIRNEDDLNDDNKLNWSSRLIEMADPYLDISYKLSIKINQK